MWIERRFFVFTNVCQKVNWIFSCIFIHLIFPLFALFPPINCITIHKNSQMSFRMKTHNFTIQISFSLRFNNLIAILAIFLQHNKWTNTIWWKKLRKNGFNSVKVSKSRCFTNYDVILRLMRCAARRLLRTYDWFDFRISAFSSWVLDIKTELSNVGIVDVTLSKDVFWQINSHTYANSSIRTHSPW